MAKTREEWITLYNSSATTAGFSTSTTADWLLFRNLFISLLILIEGIIELFKSDVNTALDTKQHLSLNWYAETAKEYQDGDSLTVIDGVQKYAVLDPTKQIITQSHATETDNGYVFVKVAKDDGSGNNVQLSGTQLTNFTNYMKKRRGPGVQLACVSLAADVVRYTIIAKYDPAYNDAALETALLEVLESFKDEFPFDAILYWSDLYAKLKIEGIKSLTLNLELTFSNGNPTVIMNEGDSLELPAGYFNYHGTNIISLTAV